MKYKYLPLTLLLFVYLLTACTLLEEPSTMEGSVSHMALGNGTVLATNADGELWTWGMILGRVYTATNQLAHARPMEQIQIPIPVRYATTGGEGNMHNARNHAMAIAYDHTLWAWGVNYQGELGDGTYQRQLQPVQVMEHVAAVATAPRVTMAITIDGVLWAWGCNFLGLLATDTQQLPRSNTSVKVMENVEAIALGAYHALAMTTDGTLWAWGAFEALGVGSPTTPITSLAELAHPTPVVVMEGVTSIAAGDGHSLALTYDGTLWTWGRNPAGQLGIGTIDFAPYPVAIKNGVVNIAASHSHSAAVTETGQLYVWGNNAYGQVGNGTVENQHTPTPILDEVVDVFIGRFNVLAVKKDGRMFAWGDNTFGQLYGAASGHIFPSPVPVLSGLPFGTLENNPLS